MSDTHILEIDPVRPHRGTVVHITVKNEIYEASEVSLQSEAFVNPTKKYKSDLAKPGVVEVNISRYAKPGVYKVKGEDLVPTPGMHGKEFTPYPFDTTIEIFELSDVEREKKREEELLEELRKDEEAEKKYLWDLQHPKKKP